MGSDSASFGVAFVCTGNRFRSVIAEAAFRSAAEGMPVRVVSYGTLELGPAEPLPAAVREAHALGLDISTHVARSLTDADLTQTSLVLGFELRHAVAAVVVAGARLERVFVSSRARRPARPDRRGSKTGSRRPSCREHRTRSREPRDRPTTTTWA